MSSSDGIGAARRAVAEEPQIVAASAAGDAEDDLVEPDSGRAEWFLPTGRAALLPDSMTESWDDNGANGSHQAVRAASSGAPPWGRDSASGGAAEPPPWETGPWPGPGEPAARQPGPAVGGPAGAAQAVAAGVAGAETAADPERAAERPQRSRLIMIGGAAVVVVVVLVVVIVVATSGSAAGCATYPVAVRQAYTQAMSDLGGGASASVRAADLERAATVANSAAAAASQITARSALFAMAGDLDEAFSDVMSHRPISPDLQQRLTADGTALPRSC